MAALLAKRLRLPAARWPWSTTAPTRLITRVARHRRRDQPARHHRLQHPPARPPRPHQGGPLASRDGEAEVFEAEALETSPLVGKPLREVTVRRRRDRRRRRARRRGDHAARRHRDPGARPRRAGRAQRHGASGSSSCSPCGSTISEQPMTDRPRRHDPHRLRQRPLPADRRARRSRSRTAASSSPTASTRSIKALGGRLCDLERHLDRLRALAGGPGASACRRSRAALAAVIARGAAPQPAARCAVYLQVDRGIAPRNHLFPKRRSRRR